MTSVPDSRSRLSCWSCTTAAAATTMNLTILFLFSQATCRSYFSLALHLQLGHATFCRLFLRIRDDKFRRFFHHSQINRWRLTRSKRASRKEEEEEVMRMFPQNKPTWRLLYVANNRLLLILPLLTWLLISNLIDVGGARQNSWLPCRERAHRDNTWWWILPLSRYYLCLVLQFGPQIGYIVNTSQGARIDS